MHGAQEFHFLHIQMLAFHIGFAHVYSARNVSQGAHRSRCHTMLSRSWLCHYARFAHSFGKQYLTERIVYLVCAGVIEVFALEIYCAAVFLAKSLCKIER